MPVLLAPIALGAFVLLSWWVLWSMQHNEQDWLRPIFYRLAHPDFSGIGRLLNPVIGYFGKIALRVEEWVAHTLGRAVAAVSARVARFFWALEQLFADTAWQIAGLAQDTLGALRALVTVKVPALIEVAVRPVRTTALNAWTLAQNLESLLGKMERFLGGVLAAEGIGVWTGLPAQLAGFARSFADLHRHTWRWVTPTLGYLFYTAVPKLTRDLGAVVGDLYGAGVDSLPGIRTRLRAAEKTLREIATDPLAWIVAVLGSAAGLLALSGVLARAAPWLFCRNTRGVASKLCGLDESMIAQLLAGTLVFALVLDPRALARVSEDVAEALKPVIRTTAGL